MANPCLRRPADSLAVFAALWGAIRGERGMKRPSSAGNRGGVPPWPLGRKGIRIGPVAVGAPRRSLGRIAGKTQLIRIQQRVPDYGWTTQKVFHLLNFLFCVLRAVSFALYTLLDELNDSNVHQAVAKLVVFDLPGLLFFTTFTLLVLFWAEIYHQASNVDTRFLRPYFIKVNVLVYVVEIILWGLSAVSLSHTWARYASAGFLSAVSVGAVVGFLVYGCRLFSMLRQFPIESRGRHKKLQEVGLITVICSACFAIRALLLILYIVDDRDFDVDLMQNPLLNIMFYVACEILAAVLVLCILHRLPPKHKAPRQRPVQGGDYQPIAASEEG
ncbi:unnamed protein product [Ostreobium quekettii]|uniref:THH1/TOM1/TOM3 domain-containing protein n=1 Tax=Ostreobium quekettii TaxID=121088 RepID=A0A8S1JBE6_9CHLO|nr:unnamed protein product [Ostreobium quekettii]